MSGDHLLFFLRINHKLLLSYNTRRERAKGKLKEMETARQRERERVSVFEKNLIHQSEHRC